MKKIFAIALAVVMVLSMASAFALSQCATWGTDWSCVADDVWCGQGKVEVVPYVMVNTACGIEFQVSDCATAIKTQDVFFAIKLTVDAYPDPGWWNLAKLDLETEGLIPSWSYKDSWVFDFGAQLDLDADGVLKADEYFGIDFKSDEQEVYYLNLATDGFVAAENATFDATSNVVFKKCVDMYDVCDPNAVSVCAELTSEYDGYSLDLYKPYNEAGDYTIGFGAVGGDVSTQPTFNKKGEMTGWFGVAEGTDWVRFYVEDGVVLGDDRSGNAFYNQVLADFGLTNCATQACFTEKNIEANFGWDDEQEDCFAWSDKGMAVVDTDCVVAIPKTGDASVLAWLF